MLEDKLADLSNVRLCHHRELYQANNPSKPNSSLFLADGVHLQENGERRYFGSLKRMIDNVIGRPSPAPRHSFPSRQPEHRFGTTAPGINRGYPRLGNNRPRYPTQQHRPQAPTQSWRPYVHTPNPAYHTRYASRNPVKGLYSPRYPIPPPPPPSLNIARRQDER